MEQRRNVSVGGKRDNLEKTRPPAASSGTILTGTPICRPDFEDVLTLRTAIAARLRGLEMEGTVRMKTELEELWRSPRVGETGDPREGPPTSGIIRHYSHVRKSGSDPSRNRARFTWVVDE
ncbi:hypothetical protein PR048_001583 [Dryococelus australis]|uniref:Uncharacterized protein n=1 Tax=Dryococelus australis TaxID=614101 RepID=A0ABQ9IHR8_9NEOP|nr:hypothetical protein PR048_001583 [Dryococelus australis]